LTGLRAPDDLDGGHEVWGIEPVCDDGTLWILHPRLALAYREGGTVGIQDSLIGYGWFQAREEILLASEVLTHRFGYELHAVNRLLLSIHNHDSIQDRLNFTLVHEISFDTVFPVGANALV